MREFDEIDALKDVRAQMKSIHAPKCVGRQVHNLRKFVIFKPHDAPVAIDIEQFRETHEGFNSQGIRTNGELLCALAACNLTWYCRLVPARAGELWSHKPT